MPLCSPESRHEEQMSRERKVEVQRFEVHGGILATDEPEGQVSQADRDFRL